MADIEKVGRFGMRRTRGISARGLRSVRSIQLSLCLKDKRIPWGGRSPWLLTKRLKGLSSGATVANASGMNLAPRSDPLQIELRL